MILSFDLDGVIADTDNGLLNLLHQAARTSGNIGAMHYLQQYYARRRILLDPRGLAGPSDEVHIVTGRVPSAFEVTRAWVKNWLGPAALENLHLVSDANVERFFEEGLTEKAAKELGLRKLRVLQYIKSQVHFDNNPIIVAYLRKEGMTAVLVGGGLL
ncbi:hypothetical protein LCGC14_2305440 [marine sediment metagenome]|uniref:Sucrose phosphatase-like domain-containing protein n=1 Tax=marine sediment metagenome TaxID=412755 RepID=A0A0F9CM80_9ZZZZ